jgi:hypothetical protein
MKEFLNIVNSLKNNKTLLNFGMELMQTLIQYLVQ